MIDIEINRSEIKIAINERPLFNWEGDEAVVRNILTKFPEFFCGRRRSLQCCPARKRQAAAGRRD